MEEIKEQGKKGEKTEGKGTISHSICYLIISSYYPSPHLLYPCLFNFLLSIFTYIAWVSSFIHTSASFFSPSLIFLFSSYFLYASLFSPQYYASNFLRTISDKATSPLPFPSLNYLSPHLQFMRD